MKKQSKPYYENKKPSVPKLTAMETYQAFDALHSNAMRRSRKWSMIQAVLMLLFFVGIAAQVTFSIMERDDIAAMILIPMAALLYAYCFTLIMDLLVTRRKNQYFDKMMKAHEGMIAEMIAEGKKVLEDSKKQATTVK